MIGYLAQLNSVEEMIAEYPSVLKFHGISQAELDEARITPQEFAYLVSSFTLGGAWYQAYGSEENKPFDGYRGRICTAEATQRAWPLLKRMMDDSPYRRKVESTIKAAEKTK
jgi:hypothetical protein